MIVTSMARVETGGAQVGRSEGVRGDVDADISGALRGARDAGFPCDSGVVWRDAG